MPELPRQSDKTHRVLVLRDHTGATIDGWAGRADNIMVNVRLGHYLHLQAQTFLATEEEASSLMRWRAGDFMGRPEIGCEPPRKSDIWIVWLDGRAKAQSCLLSAHTDRDMAIAAGRAQVINANVDPDDVIVVQGLVLDAPDYDIEEVASWPVITDA